ncbi:MAG: Rrf2 family transcriptional regulator [Caldimonas sp.]
MRLQKNTSLALYSVLESASQPERHVSAAEIAARLGASPHHLAKVLAELARAGILESARGVGGGYRFAGNARRLTLLDIVQMFEDVGPHPDAAAATPIERAIATILSEIDEHALATLASITLATMLQLIERQRTITAQPASRRGIKPI